MLGLLKKGLDGNVIPFAPPILRDGDVLIFQTAAILQYLGPRIGLVPDDEIKRLQIHSLQLVIADVSVEAHDVHHPVSISDYYENQKEQAKAKAKPFIKERIPKYIGYFEKVLDANKEAPEHSKWLVGKKLSYVDLSLFHLVDGLQYAFPKAMKQIAEDYPKVMDLHKRIKGSVRIRDYLASKRRIAFNTRGIFRYYPELDE